MYEMEMYCGFYVQNNSELGLGRNCVNTLRFCTSLRLTTKAHIRMISKSVKYGIYVKTRIN